jgi:hypothetical protein
LHDAFHLHKAGSFVFNSACIEKACWRSDIGCSWGCLGISEARQPGPDCLGVLFFFLVFLDIGVSYAVVLVICVSFSFSWSIVPFQVAAVPAIPLFMKEPGIMMLFL